MSRNGRLAQATYLVVAFVVAIALVVGCAGASAPAPKEAAKPAAEAPKPAAAAPKPAADTPKAAPKAETSKEAPKAASKEPIKVGWVGSLTGPFGSVGTSLKRGLELEIEAANKAGGVDGRPIEFVAYDDQSKAEEAVLLFKKLNEQDKVVAIFGPALSVIAIAIQPLARQANVPWMFFGSVMPTADDKYMFSTIQTVEQLIEAYVGYAGKRGWKRVAGLHPTDDLSNRASAASKAFGPKYGVDIVGEERFGLRDTDITPQATKIKGLNPQALITWGTGDPAVLAYRNTQQIGLNLPIFFNSAAANSNFFNLIGEVPQKDKVFTGGGRLMLVDSLPDSDTVKARAKDFITRFQAKYNALPEAVEGQGGDAANMLIEALKKVGPDRAKIKDYVTTMKHEGYSGTYARSAKPEGQVGPTPESIMMVTAQGKKWVKAD